MSVATSVLVLPGLGNSGPQHWQTLWELRHPDWQRVNLGNWDSPACDDWVRALDVVVQACSSPPVLVAHSLACLLVAHWAHCSTFAPKCVFLVAVPDPQSASFPVTARGFAPVPMAPFAFRSSWSPARMTRSDRWPMPSIVRLLGGAASSISARQGTSMPTADMVNGTRVMLCYNNSGTRSLSDIAENDRFGRIKITLAESRSLILSQMHAPKFSCFLMSDRLLAPYKDF